MKSLEALENMDRYCLENEHYDREDYNIIKQDLERLENLEKANILLTLKMQNEINYAIKEINKLKQENQELKDLQELNKQGLWNLKQKNQKLTKAIKLLKRFLCVECELYDEVDNKERYELRAFGSGIISDIETIQLLKEVLGNE